MDMIRLHKIFLVSRCMKKEKQFKLILTSGTEVGIWTLKREK